MSRKCRECGKGRVEIVGMGGFDDTIIVECPECGEEYELEPDGLGEGGMEMVEAFEIEMKQRERDRQVDLEPALSPQADKPGEPVASTLIRFNGVEVDTAGGPRLIELRDGLYFTGRRMLVPVNSESEGRQIVEEMRNNDS